MQKVERDERGKELLDILNKKIGKLETVPDTCLKVTVQDVYMSGTSCELIYCLRSAYYLVCSVHVHNWRGSFASHRVHLSTKAICVQKILKRSFRYPKVGYKQRIFIGLYS